MATSAQDFIVWKTEEVVTSARITIGGPTQTLNITSGSKAGVLLFGVAAGNFLTLHIPNVTLGPSGRAIGYRVFAPNGALVSSGTLPSPKSIHLPTFNISGTYSVYFTPGAESASLSAFLVQDQPAVVNGIPGNVSTTFVGQSARLTFNATAGQHMSIAVALGGGSTIGSTIRVYKPGEVLWHSGGCSPSCSLDFSNMEAGTWSVAVIPTAPTSITVTVSEDVGGVLAENTPLNLNLSRPGQKARLTFDGTAGQQDLGITLSSINIVGSTANALAYVYAPNGTQLTSMSFSNASGGTALKDLPSLPATGTYTLLIKLPGVATATMTAALRRDLTGTLTVDGTPTTVTTTIAGQKARLTFNATAGQNLGFAVSPTTNTTTVRIINPSGTLLLYAPGCYSPSGCVFDVLQNVVAGIWTIEVGSVAAISFTATLSTDLVGTLTPNSPFNLTLNRIGQRARLNFSGTAGENRTLSFNNIITNPTYKYVIFRVYRPDGTQIASTSTGSNPGGGSTTLSLNNLSVTGTYTLRVYTNDPVPSSASITLSP